MYKNSPYNIIRNDEYSLEIIKPIHIEEIRKWRNNQIDVLRQLKPISKKQQENYFKNNIWSNMNKVHPKNILFAYNHKNKFIGYGGLVHISWKELKAESSFLLDNLIKIGTNEYEKYLNNFFWLLKKFAFEELRLKKITSETFSYRTEHIALLEKLGFNKYKNQINSISVHHILLPNS